MLSTAVMPDSHPWSNYANKNHLINNLRAAAVVCCVWANLEKSLTLHLSFIWCLLIVDYTDTKKQFMQVMCRNSHYPITPLRTRIRILMVILRNCMFSSNFGVLKCLKCSTFCIAVLWLSGDSAALNPACLGYTILFGKSGHEKLHKMAYIKNRR